MDMQQLLSAAAPSASSSAMPLKKYDVFVSFRGEDTRRGFTSRLHDALIRKSIETYIDYRLEKGDEISPSLIKAIEESHISMVIFSENYASSKLCLDELTKILECKRNQGQVVIPVFYDIDPSHVRKQTGSYGQALAKHEQELKHDKDKVQKWKEALTKVANLAGWDSQIWRTESEFIKYIVRYVLQKLNLMYPSELKGLVGIEESFAQIESLLDIGSTEVKIIGIWGTAGIGKTTLAAAVYAKLSSQFEGHCFVANVKEESEKYGPNHLRKKLLSQLLEEENLHFDASKVESPFFMRRLKHTRVFIVLDDVATSEQLEYLIHDHDYLGQGSRVIVTVRDKSIVRRVDITHKVEELNLFDSLHLFCLNAFGEKHPKEGYEELSTLAITHCKGIPLALKVLGVQFHSKSIEEWKSELGKLQIVPNVKIHNVLRSSYDELNHIQKELFLDIACFFNGESRDYITSLLEACDCVATNGTEILLDKAFITISDGNRIKMHKLIQEMGWEIVCQESIKDPEKRSRLFDTEEVYDVLKNNKGTEAIEGIILDVSKIRDLHLSSDAFTKMPNVRILKFYSKELERCNVHLPYHLKSLPHKLRYLQWDGYGLESLPSTFCAEMLVELSMTHSHLEKLWDGVQKLVNLKEINLSYSKHLIEVPDFSMAVNLEVVYLEGCKSLRQLHPSILSLHKLKYLDLTGCTEIKSIQTNHHLKSLYYLSLHDCSNLMEFSVTSEEMEELWLSGTAIHELPPSIWLNKKLSHLYLQECENLNSLGNKFYDHPGVGSLTYLDLSGCKKLTALTLNFTLDGLRSLKSLELENCCNLQSLPDNIGLLSSLQNLDLSGSDVESLSPNIKDLSMLRELKLDNCRKLVSLPELPPSLQMLNAINCTSLETVFTMAAIPQVVQRNISFSLKHGLQSLGDKSVIFPGAQVPNWFGISATQTSISIPHLPQSDLRGFIFFIILSESLRNYVTAICLISKDGKRVKSMNFILPYVLISDHVYLWYCDIDEVSEIHGQASDHFNISFEFEVDHEFGYNSKQEIKGCGVCPIYTSEYQKKLELELGANIKEEYYEDIVELEPNAQSSNMQEPLLLTYNLEDSIFEPLPLGVNDIEEIQPGANGIGGGGSNNENEDDQETLLLTNSSEEVMNQTITTSTNMQNENNDLDEESFRDCCIGFLSKHFWRLVSNVSNAMLRVVLNPLVMDVVDTTENSKMETSSSEDEQPSFEMLRVSNILQLENKLPPKLDSLRIEKCTYLEALPESFIPVMPKLQELYLIDCQSFISFSPNGFPVSLRTLYVNNCPKLELFSSSESTHRFEFVEHLCIRSINNCPKLRLFSCLESAHKFEFLEHLSIGSSCDSLTDFALDISPRLQTLSLWKCSNLASFTISEGFQGDLASLKALEIRDCPKLQSFPIRGLRTPNLAKIFLSNCNMLNNIPDSKNSLLSLKSLVLHECPALESPSLEALLPSSLTSLSIAFCDKLTPHKGWGLHNLEHLSSFKIEGGCVDMESFPEEGLLPSDINSLRISKLHSLKKLDSDGFQNLNHLKELAINDCNQLESLPEPRLPSSLTHLSIKESQLLKQKLSSKAGKEWAKVAFIPRKEF